MVSNSSFPSGCFTGSFRYALCCTSVGNFDTKRGNTLSLGINAMPSVNCIPWVELLYIGLSVQTSQPSSFFFISSMVLSFASTSDSSSLIFRFNSARVSSLLAFTSSVILLHSYLTFSVTCFPSKLTGIICSSSFGYLSRILYRLLLASINTFKSNGDAWICPCNSTSPTLRQTLFNKNFNECG